MRPALLFVGVPVIAVSMAVVGTKILLWLLDR